MNCVADCAAWTAQPAAGGRHQEPRLPLHLPI